MGTLPEDSAKQRAVQSYVNQLVWQNPGMAAPWAEALTDPLARQNSLENLARQWLQTDHAAAEAWLGKVSLPDNIKQQLLKGAK